MKRSLKQRIEELGLNYKNEIIKLLLVCLIPSALTVVGFFFLKQIYILPLGIFIALFAAFFFITRYSDLERKRDESHNDEFIALLSYFEIFISNKKNVYNSFESIIPYSSPWMQERIETFLKQVDQDKTVKPFVSFSNSFTNKVVQSVMLSIFQMVESGENSESMNQFNSLFIQMSNNRQIEMIKRKESKLESLNSLPLIGAGAICIILVFSILVVVGGMINGL